MTWALASEPPRSDHISPVPVTRVVRGKKSSSLVSYRSPLANSCSPKSKFYFTKRTSSPLANNSSRRTIVHPIQNMLFGELKFAIGERSSRRTSSRRTLVRGVWFSSRERIFWRTVRQFAAEYGRTRANPGELRRTPANIRRTPANVRRSSAECRCWRTDGEFARSSREFARVRPISPEFAANDSSPGILPNFHINHRLKFKSFNSCCTQEQKFEAFQKKYPNL